MAIFEKDYNLAIEKIKENINYSYNFFKENYKEDFIRAHAIERNNKWKDEIKKFNDLNKSYTDKGKINNNYYKYKFKYDIIIQYNIYETIIEYYLLMKKEENIIEYEFENLDCKIK